MPSDEEGVGGLGDCILCVSNDGRLAVIAVNSLELYVRFLDSLRDSD